MGWPTYGSVVKKVPLFGCTELHVLIDFATELLAVDRMGRRRVRPQRRGCGIRVPPAGTSLWGWCRSGACELCFGCVETDISLHHAYGWNDVPEESRHLGKFIPAGKRRGTHCRTA